ncbi:hypothetical protein RS130_20395 [Paraglaciecola aquimarina]|uniref:Uncharacterized protein n=1 Tax=Paraglaciecola aquimarina TaxID=1235557 RepID=A0ABU3T102_9ALTE|nr:hypothetical protein [Paraglaciecola aquimarina]MDU0355933.1 hypothetical protein [Paraglaciecola aquimarina]
MSVKIIHYAKPIATSVKTIVESAFIEFSIGVICTALAFYTYGSAVVLFVSSAVIAITCWLLTLYNIYMVIQDLRLESLKRSQAKLRH